MCSFLISETIQYYKSHGSDIYMLSLDASKAFDRVKYTNVFKLLIEISVCPLVIRFLLNVYIFSSSTVKWNNCKSETFSISNVVKQGAIISAPLFAIYIDPLKDANEGCFIGNLCANAFAYADDIVLLSFSCTALRNLISICEAYAEDHEIRFNPDKCTLMIFSNLKNVDEYVNIMLCGSRIRNIANEKHLGHVFDTGFNNSLNLINIENVIRDMKVRTNTISAQFKPVSWKSKTTIFNSQCLSLYGCQLWRLDDPKVDQLCTTWKVCCRRLLNLSLRTRSRFIHHLMGTAPILDIIMYRMLSFFIAVLNNEDNLISNFFKNTLLANTLYMQVNIYKILERFNVTYHDLFSINKSKLKNILNNLKGEKDWQCNMLDELLSMRDGTVTTDLDLKYNEIKYMLNQVSTDFLFD
ncbi:unnamed protein product [Meganyctiphanes norvegica]|uniref:Reverse transcriptase domain-containing protein n=1 Tax=Meganyctiphanes norvegica TaxID=48144 RepID=A0AAV2R896_MEGNR